MGENVERQAIAAVPRLGTDSGLAYQPLPAAPRASRRRLDSIDLLRGLVMVIMALDHVRDFWHHDAVAKEAFNPVDLDATNGWLFLTRWITHYCAPTFVFLAGTGAFLYGSRGRSRTELAWFLLSRGLWLMVADMTLSRLGWAFHLWGPPNQDGVWELGAGIIWVIGAAMVLLSGLVFLPTSSIATIGISLIAFHNLLDGKTAADLGLPRVIWGILHAGEGKVAENITFGVGYGLLPCFGMICAGYALGALYLLEPPVRRRQLLGLGLTLIALFVVLRYSNLYGDFRNPRDPNHSGPGPWAERDPWYFTVFSFLNCQKYPASLLYILMTLGPSITLLGLFEGASGPIARFFVIFGRVPFFYYILHIPLIHGLAVGLDYLRFGWSPQATDGCWACPTSNPPADYGVSLPVVYLVWVLVVLLLFPLCWWFAGIKQRYRSAWLSYL